MVTLGQMSQEPRARDSSLPSLDPTGMSLHVLVVDDSDTSRAGMRMAVEDLGHRCSVARGGAEAWELVQRDRPDMIVSDWVMENGDGLELCKRVRASDGPYVYFVFASALDDKEHVLRGLDAGADDYLGKPIDVDELEARIRAATRLLVIQRRVSKQNELLRRDSRQLFAISRIDALTRTKNRRAFDEDVLAAISNAERYEQRWALGVLDIDEFKAFNDAFGHAAGDEALTRVAEAIHASLRRGDTLYRYGGEEFTVLLAEQDDQGTLAALERARRAVEALAIPHAEGAAHPVVTVSAGGRVLARGETVERWFEQADAALYRAKAAGRNAVVVG